MTTKKVKFFEASSAQEAEELINTWLYEHKDINLIDIKICCDYITFDRSLYLNYMIIYEN